MPIIHELKANDFILDVGWQPLAEFPQDGRVVEVRDRPDGMIGRARFLRKAHPGVEGQVTAAPDLAATRRAAATGRAK